MVSGAISGAAAKMVGRAKTLQSVANRQERIMRCKFIDLMMNNMPCYVYTKRLSERHRLIESRHYRSVSSIVS